MDDLIYLDAQELTRGYIRREFSPREVVTALIARRRELDPLLNAFAGCNDEMANEDADRATRHYRAQRNPPPLCGVPVGVKDLIDTRATRTSYGSRLFADHVPEKDAKVVAMMRAASMPMIGKTTTHEFAWGITCESEHYGPCRNPWDTSRIPGGSSGGSAVAVATGQACVALGTDTAGSVRIPAAFCGVVGLKPTFGLLSTSGVFPLAPSLDHIGVLTRTPRDAQTLFTTLVGQKTRLAGVLLQQPAKLAGLRVGVMDVSGAPVPEESISACVRGAADVLRDLGAVVEVERVTFADDPALTLGRVQSVEAFATHARRGLYPAHQAEYEDDVRGRLEAAAVVGLDDYLDGLEASRRIRAELEDLFERCDLLLSPVSAAVAPRIGDTAALRRLVLPFTSIQSIGGLPTCVLRAGFDPQGLPIGVQLAGPRLSDHLVLEVACAFYEATPEVQTRWPTMTGVRPRVDESPVQGAGVASG